ncbi:uncharacterized protein ARMOST_05871 [Armillaria ostoyae]|uniref:Uncharacterized protein n=1 Tax=Armillaria ostoyae TaxID=47428 RepID=A0A284R1F4_ARMOS|nr:uncharacterized protein ARMOST_05871 [Armillaria ostoyae]
MPIRLYFIKRSVDATTPALVARDIGDGHAPQIRANADIWKRKFLANEPEPIQDDEEN